MSNGSPSTAQVWQQTVSLCKDRVNSRSFWEALEQAVAITIEDDTLIIGLRPEIFNLAGHLNVSEHRNAVEQAAGSILGRRVSLRIIEGDTMADWLNRKARDARVAAHREATYERRDQQMAEAQSWDSLYDYVARAYSGTPLRSLPQSRARYTTEMVYVIAEAMDQLYPERPDENTERLLARVIDRVATNVELPSTLVAMEIERLRAWKRQNAG
jgi:hypothetical protein